MNWKDFFKFNAFKFNAFKFIVTILFFIAVPFPVYYVEFSTVCTTGIPGSCSTSVEFILEKCKNPICFLETSLRAMGMDIKGSDTKIKIQVTLVNDFIVLVKVLMSYTIASTISCLLIKKKTNI